MTTDPISDLLTRIKNGYMARLATVSVPYSRVKENITAVLIKEGYLKAVETKAIGIKKTMNITLSYEKGQPKMEDVTRVSKPGVRIYAKKGEIPTVLNGLGMVIISTSQGMMTGKTAQQKGLGGELICKVW